MSGSGTIRPRVEKTLLCSDSNPEARLVRLLRDHHFPEGQCQVEIKTSIGLPTRPDWLHESTNVAIYLDGMSRHLHGEEKSAQRDQLIRQMLELDGYKVIIVQSRDLNDPQAVRMHLRNIAKAISRNDLAEMIDEAGVIELPPAQEIESSLVESSEPPTTPDDESELLEYTDERCRGFLKKWIAEGHPRPVVGYGLEDGDGIVIAEAERAWADQKVAALFDDQDGKEDFEAADWTVFDAARLEESMSELVKKMGNAQ
jgi:G:T-mismatch repair DNA endonuclease (very short patch repair protein)